MYDKDKEFTVLELSRDSLEIVIRHLQLSKGVMVSSSTDRVILNPYTNETIQVPNLLSLKETSTESGIEDIHYVVDSTVYTIKGLGSRVIRIVMLRGSRFLHHLDKDFEMVLMHTDNIDSVKDMEYMCGELGDSMIPIPYMHCADTSIGDMIETLCVLNN